jgi:transposase
MTPSRLLGIRRVPQSPCGGGNAASRGTGSVRERTDQWRARSVPSAAGPPPVRASALAQSHQPLWPSSPSCPGQDVTASIVADLAVQLLTIGARISELDARIASTFRAHPQAEIIESLPGVGPIRAPS